MAGRSVKSDGDVRLVRPREEVIATVTDQLKNGEALQERPINSVGDLRTAKEGQQRWAGATAQFLRIAFDSPSIAEAFEGSRRLSLSRSQAPLTRQVANFHEDMAARLNSLRSLLGRVEWMRAAGDAEVATTEEGGAVNTATSNRDVFIVHGRDEAARNKLAAFLRKIGLNATILDEVPSAGRTIIEKFEQTAETVGYAIVLLTPDDAGTLKGADNLQDRARQNVIYELGYFAGKLGRGRVCLLQKGKVEIPSDLHGVVYISLDNGDWQLRLAGEMNVVGMAVDTAKLLGT